MHTPGLHTLDRSFEPYSDPLFDIIFVHSLFGDPRLTWTSGDLCWQDWLQEDTELCKGRIHTFCYQSFEQSDHGESLANRLKSIGAKLCSAIASNTEVGRSAHVTFLHYSEIHAWVWLTQCRIESFSWRIL